MKRPRRTMLLNVQSHHVLVHPGYKWSPMSSQSNSITVEDIMYECRLDYL